MRRQSFICRCGHRGMPSHAGVRRAVAVTQLGHDHSRTSGCSRQSDAATRASGWRGCMTAQRTAAWLGSIPRSVPQGRSSAAPSSSSSLPAGKQTDAAWEPMRAIEAWEAMRHMLCGCTPIHGCLALGHTHAMHRVIKNEGRHASNPEEQELIATFLLSAAHVPVDSCHSDPQCTDSEPGGKRLDQHNWSF